MDNQQIDVTSEGEAGILRALEIIWPAAAIGGDADFYRIVKLKPETRYYATKREGRTESLIANCYGLPEYHVHHCGGLKEADDGVPTLILLWSEERGATKFPFPLSIKQSAQFIIDWLGSLDYGWQPDHDGDNGKGWRLFTESWGHVAGHSYAIIAAQPAWAMYGK
jgi:hypothetical protein